ncbi:MAG: hypothetical protein NC913_06030 [Candidatus Omnitrophica bacterium]|nr:hypothetical protein [Candidatus Omnitrophota bacterium]
MVKKGLSILELLVAIFLITIVIGTGLLIIAANLNVMKKSNEMLIAAAVAQYHIEIVKTIDFPPVFVDRQSYFPKKISDSSSFDTTYLVPSVKPDFKIYMGCVWYNENGDEIASDTELNKVILRKVKIEVRRNKDNYSLFSMPVYIVRNGVY